MNLGVNAKAMLSKGFIPPCTAYPSKNRPTTYPGHDKAFLIGCLIDGLVPNEDRTGSVQVFRRAILFRSKTLERYNPDHLIT